MFASTGECHTNFITKIGQCRLESFPFNRLERVKHRKIINKVDKIFKFFALAFH